MGTIVLVVASTGSLTSGDQVMQAALQAAGHTVVLRNDEDAEYGGTYDGVMVSDSCSGGTLGSKYDTVAKPGITCENASWRLGTYLGGINGTQWTVENVEGNGGLTGTQTIYTTTISQQGIDTDTLPSAATVVARLAGDADHGVYVTYAEGGNLTSGTAPAKRVFLRIGDSAMANLATAGETILAAAIDWAFAAAETTANATTATLSVAGQNATTESNPRNVFPAEASISVAAQNPSVVTTGAPGGLYDLSLWKITLPTDGPDGGTNADEITQPALNTYEDDNFFLDGSGNMTMIAPVQGSTTSGSGGTRCELREMWGGVDEADWTPFDTDFHQLTVTMTADPTSCTDRKEMIVAQIHGTTGSPPIYIAKEHHVATPRLRVYKDGPGVGNMLSGIGATDTFTIRFEYLPSTGGPEGGTLNIYAGLGEVADLPGTPSFTYTGDQFADNSGWYFKTGAYNKSEVANGGTGESITKISYLELIQPGNPDAGNATFTFSANNATISSIPDADEATLGVAAQDATVLIDEGGTTVNAGVATLGTVAEDATASTAPTSGDPSASIESLDVSAEIVGSAGTGSVGVAAEDATAQVVVNPSTATLSVAAQDASIPAGAPTETIEFGVAALDSAITRQQPPEAATLSLAAAQAGSMVATGGDGASLNVAALDAVITTGGSVIPITAGITMEMDAPGWSATFSPIEALLVLAALSPSADVPDEFGLILSLTRASPSIVGVSSRPGPAIIAVQREIGEAGGV